MAQDFLQNQVGSLAIAHQNVLESFSVLTHPKFANPMSPDEAAEALGRITAAAQLIFSSYKTMAVAQALIQKHQLKGDAVSDAYLAATALTAGITAIATDNVKDFEKFEQIKVVSPFRSMN